MPRSSVVIVIIINIIITIIVRTETARRRTRRIDSQGRRQLLRRSQGHGQRPGVSPSPRRRRAALRGIRPSIGGRRTGQMLALQTGRGPPGLRTRQVQGRAPGDIARLLRLLVGGPEEAGGGVACAARSVVRGRPAVGEVLEMGQQRRDGSLNESHAVSAISYPSHITSGEETRRMGYSQWAHRRCRPCYPSRCLPWRRR